VSGVGYGRHFLKAFTSAPPGAPGPSTNGSDPVGQGALATIGEDVPPSLLRVVAAAVDPLEIAASLETCGLSNAVVKDRFGWDNVFSLARQLYREVEPRATPASDPRPVRPGNLSDLGRGLVFAAPTLMFAGAAIALRSWLSWWTLPLSLTCGWAFSQVVSYVGFSGKARSEPPGSLVVWGMIVAPIFCAAVGFAGVAILGGRFSGALFAAAGCAFMTAAAELVVHGEELLIAVMLLPGATGSLIFITGVPFHLPVDVAVALAALSVIGTVAIALRHVPKQWWRARLVGVGDGPVAACYFALGLCSGVLVAIFIVLEPARGGAKSWPGLAAYPMVLSLGAMEWELRSLRARTRRELLVSPTITAFARDARRQLVRATLIYFAVLAALTILVEMAAELRGVAVPVPLVIAGTTLALAFFMALVVAACGRVDLVLRAWLPGIAAYTLWGLCSRLATSSWPVADARFAFCITAIVSLIALVAVATQVIANPVCHG
jgi:hypothetical protein